MWHKNRRLVEEIALFVVFFLKSTMYILTLLKNYLTLHKYGLITLSQHLPSETIKNITIKLLDNLLSIDHRGWAIPA